MNSQNYFWMLWGSWVGEAGPKFNTSIFGSSTSSEIHWKLKKKGCFNEWQRDAVLIETCFSNHGVVGNWMICTFKETNKQTVFEDSTGIWKAKQNTNNNQGILGSHNVWVIVSFIAISSESAKLFIVFMNFIPRHKEVKDYVYLGTSEWNSAELLGSHWQGCIFLCYHLMITHTSNNVARLSQQITKYVECLIEFNTLK